ncbi:TetR/AcrR family transcriptional regulator [Roseovarius nitratireducens]|uniref:TetR/AcrR family transcriptional regulator n=1 Tax=Roseovarius nitratireducens TaxID=2044597 RepID=UPI000CE16415|nr:TetR family transcriptional regulator C-terminal domain-containing protein [Roseovarius nitratireducens]
MSAAIVKNQGDGVGRTASKEFRRHQLIMGAIVSISKFGLSGTTVTTITSAADLSVGLVNFHFGSKQKLLEETLRFLAGEHREQWRESVRNSGMAPAEKLLAIVDAHFVPHICNRDKLTVWFGFYGEAGYRAHYRDIMSEIDAERWDVSADLCRQIVEEGGYENIDPEHVAESLEGFYDGFWLNILIYPEDFSRQDAKNRIRTYLATTFPRHSSEFRTVAQED